MQKLLIFYQWSVWLLLFLQSVQLCYQQLLHTDSYMERVPCHSLVYKETEVNYSVLLPFAYYWEYPLPFCSILWLLSLMGQSRWCVLKEIALMSRIIFCYAVYKILLMTLATLFAFAGSYDKSTNSCRWLHIWIWGNKRMVRQRPQHFTHDKSQAWTLQPTPQLCPSKCYSRMASTIMIFFFFSALSYTCWYLWLHRSWYQFNLYTLKYQCNLHNSHV